MSINKNHPTYPDFLKNELKTLEFLSSPFIASSIYELSTSAQVISAKYLNINKRHLNNSKFEFHTNFDLVIEGKLRRIVIEATANPSYNFVTYYMAICGTPNQPYSLLRKIHFDYALPDSSSPKPVYHIQYGGEASPYLKNLEIDVKVLNPWLSSPRINFTPINLALFLDIVFYEFQSVETIKIINQQPWKNLIMENEITMLKPYYLNVSDFLKKHHKSSFLLREYYYGKQ